MVCFRNVVRGFSLVLHESEGAHYKKQKLILVEAKNSEKDKYLWETTGQTY